MSEPSASGSRVAAVGYLNARPLCEALDREPAIARVRARAARSPSEVARARRRGRGRRRRSCRSPRRRRSAICASCAACAIGARGPVRSVVARRPSARSTSSTSSRSTCRRARASCSRGSSCARRKRSRAAARRRARRRDAIASDRRIARRARHRRPGARRSKGRFAHTLDLGQAWLERTGLPFVFAAWCGRAGRAVARTTSGSSATRSTRASRAATRSPTSTRARTGLSPRVAPRLPHATRSATTSATTSGAGSSASTTRPRTRASCRATRVRFFDDDRSAPIAAPVARHAPRARRRRRAPQRRGGRAPPRAKASLFDLGLAADAVRQRKHPNDVVTYIVDRNVNYTNVCTTSCRFCAFYRPVGHPEGYVLSREVLGKKLQEVVDAGGVQILLQGGLNPDLPHRVVRGSLPLDEERVPPRPPRALARGDPPHRAPRELSSVRRVLERLHAAGLDSVPGGGAEILVDRVRRKIAKAKCTSEEWLERDARRAPDGPALERDDDVRHRRHARAIACSTS